MSRCASISTLLLLGTAAAIADPVKAPRAADNAGYLLRYRFRTNDPLYFEVEHDTTFTTTKGSLSETTTHKARESKHLHVVAVDKSGAAIVEPMLDRVRLSARIGSGSAISYDSQSKKTPPRYFREIAASIGKPIVRMKVTQRGKVESTVRLFRPLRRSGITTGGRNDESRNFLLELPEKRVKVGDAWSDASLSVRLRLTSRLTRDYRVLRKYKFEKLEGDLATISLRSVSLTPLTEPSLQVQMIQWLPEGEIVFDVKRGAIVSRTTIVDKRIVGFAGSQSLLKVTSRRVERLVDRRSVAQREKP